MNCSRVKNRIEIGIILINIGNRNDSFGIVQFHEENNIRYLSYPIIWENKKSSIFSPRKHWVSNKIIFITDNRIDDAQAVGLNRLEVYHNYIEVNIISKNNRSYGKTYSFLSIKGKNMLYGLQIKDKSCFRLYFKLNALDHWTEREIDIIIVN